LEDHEFEGPFDPWALAEAMGDDEQLVTVDGVTARSYQLTLDENSAWKSKQRYRRLQLGLEEEPEEHSPLVQFTFAWGCERERRDFKRLIGNRDQAVRLPGNRVLTLTIHCAEHGLAVPSWLASDLSHYASQIWSGEKSEWWEAFGKPHKEDKRTWRSQHVDGPRWYWLALQLALQLLKTDASLTVGAVYSDIAKAEDSKSRKGCSPQRICDCIQSYVDAQDGYAPTPEEFLKILRRYPDCTLEHAVDHHFWERWKRRGWVRNQTF